MGQWSPDEAAASGLVPPGVRGPWAICNLSISLNAYKHTYVAYSRAHLLLLCRLGCMPCTLYCRVQALISAIVPGVGRDPETGGAALSFLGEAHKIEGSKTLYRYTLAWSHPRGHLPA